MHNLLTRDPAAPTVDRPATLANLLGSIATTSSAINAWLNPQNSAHCPR